MAGTFPPTPGLWSRGRPGSQGGDRAGRLPCTSWGELGAKLRQVLGRGQSVTLSQEEGAGQASARGQDRHGVVY